MKTTLKTILITVIVCCFSSCTIKVEELYHSNATVETHIEVKVNDKALSAMNQSASKDKNKKEELEKFLNQKLNLHQVLVEEGVYDTIPFDEVQFFKKINFEVVSDKTNNDSIREFSFNVNIEPYNLEEVSKEVLHFLEQGKELLDTMQDVTTQERQKIAQAFVEIREMMGERANAWDGKKLDLTVEAYQSSESDKDVKVKKMTSEEIEQTAQFINNMIGEVSISYMKVFDKEIKCYNTDHPLYKQIDNHTLGFKVNIIEFLTKSEDEYQIHVETK